MATSSYSIKRFVHQDVQNSVEQINNTRRLCRFGSSKGNPLMNVRSMIRADMPAVVEIEFNANLVKDAEFEIETMGPLGWNEDQLYSESQRKGTIAKVLCYDDGEHKVLGFIFYTIGKKTVRVLKMEIDTRYSLNDLGKKFIDYLKDRFGFHKTLEIITPESKLSHLNFYKGLGFKAIKLIKNFSENAKQNPEDDYIIMRLATPMMDEHDTRNSEKT